MLELDLKFGPAVWRGLVRVSCLLESLPGGKAGQVDLVTAKVDAHRTVLHRPIIIAVGQLERLKQHSPVRRQLQLEH
jgi:hypothetical protein